ncbi:MAG: WecB/TagA/CpsF family glycosyltransferase [Steroidobacter sp.]
MTEPVQLQFDDYDLEGFVDVARNFGASDFEYVVTPNTDHLIRYHDDGNFRSLYAAAGYVLLDSRFLSYLFKLVRGVSLPVCAGSDLTAALIKQVITPDDQLILIGATERQAQMLRDQFKLRRLQHFNPPMGFIKDSSAVETCLQFIEQHSPARFIFLAVGSPQQEILARHIKQRGRTHGMGLCIGASINFLTGEERRAPRWMQRIGCEWLYRLIQDPRRLAKRYLVRGPRIFVLLRHIRVSLRNKS